MSSNMLLFQPWVGPDYVSSGFNGQRILILGESHYGEPEQEMSSFTIQCIEGMAKGACGHSFFTKTAKLFIECPAGVPLEQAARIAFWNSVAFFNYVQSFPSNKARRRPTKDMWERAASVFPRVLACLDPAFVLVLGRALAANLPELDKDVAMFSVPHPSSFGFKPQQWRPQIRSELERCRQRQLRTHAVSEGLAAICSEGLTAKNRQLRQSRTVAERRGELPADGTKVVQE